MGTIRKKKIRHIQLYWLQKRTNTHERGEQGVSIVWGGGGGEEKQKGRKSLRKKHVNRQQKRRLTMVMGILLIFNK